MDRFRIGDMTLHRIEEWQGGFAPPSAMFRRFDEALWQPHEHELVPDYHQAETGLIYGFLQSWLIDTGAERILFDTGAGNDKERPGIPIFGGLQTEFLDRLGAAGFQPGDIDTVVCSHLHIDHVGWNTIRSDDGWKATFPNARYILPLGDRAYWDPNDDSAEPSATGKAVNAGVFEDSVQPLIDQNRVEWAEDGFEVLPGIDLFAVAGHTPGHLAMRVLSGGDSALFVGDVLHHPIQIHNPDWNSQFCEDQDRARESRRAVLEEAAQRGSLLVPAHFGGVHAVRVLPEGSLFRPVYCPERLA
jgi:glyoxylase-like metal-dependent hydrolase (beta-lactamase superfamily II)